MLSATLSSIELNARLDVFRTEEPDGVIRVLGEDTSVRQTAYDNFATEAFQDLGPNTPVTQEPGHLTRTRVGMTRAAGTAGDDYVVALHGHGELLGGNGEDILAVMPQVFDPSESVYVEAGPGNDRIYALTGRADVDGGKGYDILFIGDGEATYTDVEEVWVRDRATKTWTLQASDGTGAASPNDPRLFAVSAIETLDGDGSTHFTDTDHLLASEPVLLTPDGLAVTMQATSGGGGSSLAVDPGTPGDLDGDGDIDIDDVTALSSEVSAFQASISTDLGALNGGVYARDNYTQYPGYMLYSATDLSTRFTAHPPRANTAEHFITVFWHPVTQDWRYDPDTSGIAYSFTPQAGDVLVAELDFAADTVTMLEGQTGTEHGIQRGYFSGDLEVHQDRFGSATTVNADEFFITGTHFVADEPSLTATQQDADVFKDGVLDRLDVNHIVQGLYGTMIYDGNLSLQVEQGDQDKILQNWGSYTGWENGDYSGNGRVLQEDLDFVLQNWGDLATDPVTLVGTPGDDILYGYRGDDTVVGGDGTDFLWGGSGDDVFTAGSSLSTVYGGEGNDRSNQLFQDYANDVLDGEIDTDLRNLFGSGSDPNRKYHTIVSEQINLRVMSVDIPPYDDNVYASVDGPYSGYSELYSQGSQISISSQTDPDGLVPGVSRVTSDFFSDSTFEVTANLAPFTAQLSDGGAPISMEVAVEATVDGGRLINHFPASSFSSFDSYGYRYAVGAAPPPPNFQRAEYSDPFPYGVAASTLSAVYGNIHYDADNNDGFGLPSRDVPEANASLSDNLHKFISYDSVYDGSSPGVPVVFEISESFADIPFADVGYRIVYDESLIELRLIDGTLIESSDYLTIGESFGTHGIGPGNTVMAFVYAAPDAEANQVAGVDPAILFWVTGTFGTFDPSTIPGGPGTVDVARFKFAEIDLDVATMNAGIAGAVLSEEVEDAEGAFLPVNNDDDNYDGTPDIDHGFGPIVGENDLLPITLRPIHWEHGGFYRLDIPEEVRVWERADRADEVTAETAIDATVETTLYVEGQSLTEDQATLGLQWQAGENEPLTGNLDEIQLTVFEWDGPLNVPSNSKYAYSATGVEGGEWITTQTGQVVGGVGTADAVLFWHVVRAPNHDLEVGKARFKASDSYTWDLDVNVVSVSKVIELGQIHYNADAAYDGGVVEHLIFGDFYNVFSYDFASDTPAAKWQTSIFLEGPENNRGVEEMKIGFVQNITVEDFDVLFSLHNRYLESDLVGGTYLDYADESPGPWASTLAGTVHFNEVHDELAPPFLQLQDSPSVAFPLQRFFEGELDDADAIYARWDFDTALVMSTDDDDHAVMTRRAHFNWKWEISAGVRQIFGGHELTLLDGGATGDNVWTWIDDGSVPVVTTGPQFNGLLQQHNFHWEEALT